MVLNLIGSLVVVGGTATVATPILDSHAATKEYVDSHSGGLPTGGTNGSVLIMTSDGPMWDDLFLLLTWPGSTHSAYDCYKIGGTKFDTGNGTICRLPSGTIPSGWTQAANWARYYPTTWDGDDCGRNKSYASTAEFANEKTTRVYPTDCYWCGHSCSGCCNGCNPGYWMVCDWEGDGYYYYYASELVEHVETNRVEVGIY